MKVGYLDGIRYADERGYTTAGVTPLGRFALRAYRGPVPVGQDVSAVSNVKSVSQGPNQKKNGTKKGAGR